MDRNGQHVGPSIEDVLGAVPVVHVDVEDGHSIVVTSEPLGRYGGVVEKAESARHIGKGVVAGRTAEPVGEPLAIGHGRCRRHRRVGRRQRGPVGVGSDRAGGVGHVPTGPSDDAIRIAHRIPRRMNVGDDLRCFRAGERRPALVGVAQEVQVAAGVRSGHRFEPEIGRLLDLETDPPHAGEQAIDSFRLVGTERRDTAHEEEVGLVDDMDRIVEHPHRIDEPSIGVAVSSSATVGGGRHSK